MDYSQLPRDAWALTLRHRFLWVLGLLAGGGGSVVSCGGAGNGFNQPNTRGSDNADVNWSNVSGWLSDHLAIVIAVAAGVAVLVLLLAVLNVIATGGIARATSELAQGRTATFGSAWQAGIAMFWRYAGLILIALAFGLVALAVFGMLFLAGGWRALVPGGYSHW